MEPPTGKASIAKEVRAYLEKRPVIQDALALGIVNLSALTRKIMEDKGWDQEEAILVACRRYQRSNVRPFDDGVRRVLVKSKLEVRTRIAVWTLRPSWNLFTRLEKAIPLMQGQSSQVHVLHGSEAVTVIADETLALHLEELLEPEDILSVQLDLVELNLKTPEPIEGVRGILAFVTTSLAARGVNLIEAISCHKDNMFVITNDDLFAAFEVLNPLIRQ